MKITNKLKNNNKGFGHIEMLLIVVAVVVIGGVGFFVYQNHNKKTATKSTAHAGAWTNLGSSNLVYGNVKKVATTVSVFACASPVKSGNTFTSWNVDWGYTSSNPSVVLVYDSSVYNDKSNSSNQLTVGKSSGSWYITPAKNLPENIDTTVGGYLTTAVGGNGVFINIGGGAPYDLWTGLGTPQAEFSSGDGDSPKVNLASC